MWRGGGKSGASARAGTTRRLVLYPALAIAGGLLLVFLPAAWQRPANGRQSATAASAPASTPALNLVADSDPAAVAVPATAVAPQKPSSEPRKSPIAGRTQPYAAREGGKSFLDQEPTSPQIAAGALALRAELDGSIQNPRPTAAPAVPTVPAQVKATQVPARLLAGAQPVAPAPNLPAPTHMKDTIRVYLDIPYASVQGVDPRQLSLDVYTPEGAMGQPVVVFVHGGGWSGGDKSEIGQKDRAMIAAGYVFASINYRLLPAGAHPANVKDVARALAWIHKHIAGYGGNPERIFVVGHSAGAQLSGLVATDERYLAAESEKLTLLKGVVLLDSNAYDIPKLIPHLADDGNVYVTAFGKKESPLWRDASPVAHVAPGKGIPPFLVVHANRDPSRAEQAESMTHALKAAGIRGDLLDIPDRDHVSLCDQLGTTGDRTTAAVLDFFLSVK